MIYIRIIFAYLMSLLAAIIGSITTGHVLVTTDVILIAFTIAWAWDTNDNRVKKGSEK